MWVVILKLMPLILSLTYAILVGFLKIISDALEPAAKVVTTIKKIIPAILAFFGL